ncbi:hypothetical protein [Bailinhaonella thermotolerans]|uniref:hypothetical protein n=1 Tax=Bailinhaonella thermotolerans TaxID=1070861 RepID=UPI00192A621B|nr:hypothetical protein [Bailinhaonella thermotolerans]
MSESTSFPGPRAGVPVIAQSPEITIASLAEEFPGWVVWRSDAGRVWATSRRGLSGEEMAEGCARVVDGDDPGGLAAVLREQEVRRARAARVRADRERAALGLGWVAP